METAALYERILTLIPANELHTSCTDELRERLSSINHALDDVTAAFTKLQEIRDAVTKLGRSTVSTGSQLTTEIDATMELDVELGIQLRTVLSIMTKNANQPMEKPVTFVTAEKTIQPRKTARGDANVVWLKSDASRVDGTPNFYHKLVATANGLPLTDRVTLMPEILLALSDLMDYDQTGEQRYQVRATLQMIANWVRLVGQHLSIVEDYPVYTNYMDTLDAYLKRIPGPSQKDQLYRLMYQLSHSIIEIKCSPEIDTTSSITPSGVPTAGRSSSFSHGKCFIKLVPQLNEMECAERKKQFLRLLVAFKRETASSISNTHSRELRAEMEVVAGWMKNDRDDRDIRLYHLFADGIRKIAAQMPISNAQRSMASLADRMHEILLDEPTPRAQQQLADIQARAAFVQLQISQWQVGHMKSGDASKCINWMEAIINHAAVGWEPRQNRELYKCAMTLKSHVEQLQVKKRPKYLRKIASWKLQDPS